MGLSGRRKIEHQTCRQLRLDFEGVRTSRPTGNSRAKGKGAVVVERRNVGRCHGGNMKGNSFRGEDEMNQFYN